MTDRTKSFLGFDNKYGRPIPYVWFIILAVSSLPVIMIATVTGGIHCDESLLHNGTPEEYLESTGLTIHEGIEKCSSTMDISNKIAYGISVVFFMVLTWSLKPYPLSDPEKDDDDLHDSSDDTQTERRTPV